MASAFPPVAPRSAGYAPAVKVMTQQPHAEGALVLFNTEFKDKIDLGTNKKIRLHPKCLVECALTPRTLNGAHPLRNYINVADVNDVCIGFTLDSVPGGNGAVTETEAISVQTHGFIDLGLNMDSVAPNTEVKWEDLSQPPTDIKQADHGNAMFDAMRRQLYDRVIGHVITQLDRQSCDPATGFCRARVRLSPNPAN